jgi:UDP-2,4-diacetamido-2,4,6-trideoxy-beta-L-altropyranose hydrolase
MADHKLLILTEAGDGIGYGHYSRCSAIKRYFESKNVHSEIHLFVKGENTSIYDDSVVVNWHENTASINADGRFTHLLVDSYIAPVSLFDQVRKRFKKVIALDDYHRINEGPDLIINPNIFGDKIEYAGNFVGGTSFVILRSAFASEKRKNPLRQNINKVLITLGGSDVRQLMPVVTNVIKDLNSNFSIQLVGGSEAYRITLRDLFCDDANVAVYGFLSEQRMKEMMLDTDITISACGQTLHELAWLGVPVVGVCIDEDQVPNMKEYNERGFISEQLYWHDPDFEKKLGTMVTDLIPLYQREKVAAIGKQAIDGLGLTNIYVEVFK